MFIIALWIFRQFEVKRKQIVAKATWLTYATGLLPA